MPSIQVEKAPDVVLKKLSDLFYSLQSVKMHFENAANNVKDNLMRVTLRGVAQESCQYANELSCKIQTMGGNLEEYSILTDGEITNSGSSANNTGVFDDDIVKECAADEVEMIKAYRELLNDSNLYTDLRSMMRYQLNGIMYGFLQIKLLYN